MLRVNRETDYAIRVILALATYPPGEIIPSAVIRQEMLLPESLSVRIISQLAHLNLIKSYPGRNGGIQLARPSAEITLYDVIRGMEGPLTLSECLEEGSHCELSPHCPVQEYWVDLRKRLTGDLKSVNFQNLSKRAKYLSARQ
jgi:Rrf2 family protein